MASAIWYTANKENPTYANERWIREKKREWNDDDNNNDGTLNTLKYAADDNFY